MEDLKWVKEQVHQYFLVSGPIKNILEIRFSDGCTLDKNNILNRIESDLKEHTLTLFDPERKKTFDATLQFFRRKSDDENARMFLTRNGHLEHVKILFVSKYFENLREELGIQKDDLDFLLTERPLAYPLNLGNHNKPLELLI